MLLKNVVQKALIFQLWNYSSHLRLFKHQLHRNSLYLDNQESLKSREFLTNCLVLSIYNINLLLWLHEKKEDRSTTTFYRASAF